MQPHSGPQTESLLSAQPGSPMFEQIAHQGPSRRTYLLETHPLSAAQPKSSKRSPQEVKSGSSCTLHTCPTIEQCLALSRARSRMSGTTPLPHTSRTSAQPKFQVQVWSM